MAKQADDESNIFFARFSINVGLLITVAFMEQMKKVNASWCTWFVCYQLIWQPTAVAHTPLKPNAEDIFFNFQTFMTNKATSYLDDEQSEWMKEDENEKIDRRVTATSRKNQFQPQQPHRRCIENIPRLLVFSRWNNFIVDFC